jgi:PIN domain nuclease of toxin-antitoxin system
VLLDTHAFLWFVMGDARLSATDPFDRLLVAQAMADKMPLVSIDTVVDAYPVTRIW